MKQEYVNAFIKAAIEVLATTTQVSFTTGKPSLRNSPLKPDEVIVSLGVTGQLRGRVVISLKDDCAKLLASKMMMGKEVSELDEIARSALCELGNMVMGNVATLLFNQGTQIDITPPSLITGQHLEISTANMVTISIPLESDSFTVTLDICVEESEK